MKTAFLLLAIGSASALDTEHSRSLRTSARHHHHHHGKHHGKPLSGIEQTVETAEAAKGAGPAVVTVPWCASILKMIEKQQPPYWDKEGLEGNGCCSEDRIEVIQQCESKMQNFMGELKKLCPGLRPEENEGDEDFKKAKYVASLKDMKTSSQHHQTDIDVKKEAWTDCPDPCEGEECPCKKEEEEKKPLKRTPDGKPVAEWAAHPEAPSMGAEQIMSDAQALGPDCDGKEGKPCEAKDFKSMSPPTVVSEDPAKSERKSAHAQRLDKDAAAKASSVAQADKEAGKEAAEPAKEDAKEAAPAKEEAKEAAEPAKEDAKAE